MLKFIRKYKHILLVAFGVLLMVAFLLPQAIQEMTSQRNNVTVMKIGHRKVSAKQHHEYVMEYELLNRFAGGLLPLMGIPEGPDQWILLSELAQRGGYVGAGDGQDMIEEIGKTRAILRLQRQYGELVNNPQFQGFFQNQIDDEVNATKASYPRIASETHLSDPQIETTLAKFKGVQRLIRAYAGAARVSAPRAVLRAERDLQGAQIEYVFASADREAANVANPDDATLQAFMETYKDTKPGEGEFGIGYMLPSRVKLEYLVLDGKKIGDRIVPDLKELRRRYNAQADKTKSFDDSRPELEQQIRRETLDRVMTAARETVRSKVALATRKLDDDGQFKVLPDDWAAKRPTLASMTAEIAKHVEEKTGVKIDPPEVVVKDASYLTREDLAALELIGKSSIPRGQQRASFADYALAVRELLKTTPLSLQTGVPCDEPTTDESGSTFFFTILDTRAESTPKSIDEVREKLVADWKKVQAYKLLAEQDAPAFLQKAIAEGIGSLDESAKTPTEPGKPLPPSQIKNGRVTRKNLSNGDPNVNTDIFRIAVIEAAQKLDPLSPNETYTAEQRTLSVKLPQKLGVATVRIVSVLPLTQEEFRGRQNGIVQQFQQEEFASLKANPFSLDRLKTRLNVEYVGENEKKNAAANVGG